MTPRRAVIPSERLARFARSCSASLLGERPFARLKASRYGVEQTALASPWALVHVLVLSAAVTVSVSAWVLIDLGGWSYYRAPLEARGATSEHRLLRPAGRVGQMLGIAGMAMMTVPVAYVARKRWFRSPLAGSMRAWLNLHIFAGIVGPVLITFHTSFKFNGVISVAYWSMVAVMLSGFVGHQNTKNPNHAAGGFPTSCEACHRATDASWAQGTFNHTWFPIASGRHAGNPCVACHTNPTNYKVFTCLTCHDRGSTDPKHRDVRGYVYDSQACYSCHPQGRE